MIVTKKDKKVPSIYFNISKLWGAFPKIKTRPFPIPLNFKKLVLIIFISIIFWTFLLGVIVVRKSHKSGWKELALVLNLKGREAKHNFKSSVKAVALAPFKWAAANISNQEIPEIHIDIKFKHMQKLQKKRDDALKVKLLIQGPDDYVPAKIRFRDKTHKVKLRLKGDWVDHLEGDKWSFRVHVKGDDHLFGMRRFSLQHPRTRKFEGEILYFEALKREGVLAPRYFFVEVHINGRNIGLMALEEHFSKELLESQGRRESVIIRFDESNVWMPQRDQLFESFKLTKIIPFRIKKIAQSEKFSADLNAARGLLRGFVNRKLPPSKVFDPVLMGRFIAVSDVWRAWHQLGHWNNYVFYYNPITAFLEPIGYDGDIPRAKKMSDPSPFSSPLVSAIIHGDPRIRSVYQQTVERLVRELDEGATEKWVRPLADKQLRILHKEFPTLKGLGLELIAERTRATNLRIKDMVNRYPEILQAFLVNDGKESLLELVNPLPHALEVQDIKCAFESEGKIPEVNFYPRLTLPFMLKPTRLGDLPEIRRFSYQISESEKDCLPKIKVRILGEEINQWVESQPYSPVLSHHPLPKMISDKTLTGHRFLKFDEDSKTMSVQPGDWEVNNWIVIPENMKLKIPAGTTLRFNSDSGLLSNGPVSISGTLKAPVVLMGVGNLAEKKLWQGISVLRSQQPSIWTHVKIMNTGGIKKEGWQLSGGVNFYESEIQMKDVTIIGNQSEDALNIVRSKFELDSVNIKDAVSDAFDSDFSNGVVRGGVYENIGHAGGGDGIDVSGSEITVTGTLFKNISDKALSVGEKSTMTAKDLSIGQVGTAAVSKDGSHLTLSKSKIDRVKTSALMAYNKKKEYGHGTIVASQLDMQSVASPAVSQKGSRISIDGKDIEQTDLNVKQLYATLMKSVKKK
jgi:hypothetical protein